MLRILEGGNISDKTKQVGGFRGRNDMKVGAISLGKPCKLRNQDYLAISML